MNDYLSREAYLTRQIQEMSKLIELLKYMPEESKSEALALAKSVQKYLEVKLVECQDSEVE